MGNASRVICVLWLVNANRAKKLQKKVTIHSFLPTLLFPHSTSLTWRKNVYRHCPSRMVSGFVAKAQNSGTTDPGLFSTLGSLSPLAMLLPLYMSWLWASFPFPSQGVLKDIYNLFLRSLCSKNFIAQLKSHGARFWLLHAWEGWPSLDRSYVNLSLNASWISTGFHLFRSLNKWLPVHESPMEEVPIKQSWRQDDGGVLLPKCPGPLLTRDNHSSPSFYHRG